MKAEFLEAITAVLKESEIDLSIRDIESLTTNDTDLVMHVRNDQEMFEFKIFAYKVKDSIEMNVVPVIDSPYSCDNVIAYYDTKNKSIRYC